MDGLTFAKNFASLAKGFLLDAFVDSVMKAAADAVIDDWGERIGGVETESLRIVEDWSQWSGEIIGRPMVDRSTFSVPCGSIPAGMPKCEGK